jgi:geranylgeranyl diphosphate synthase type I
MTVVLSYPDLAAQTRASVEDFLESFIAPRTALIKDPNVAPFVNTLRNLVQVGGKRLRPLMVFCGWHAAGGGEDTRAAITLAASVELFHTFALIHDDIMDNADSRRGEPTAHVSLNSTDAAIILGDLTMVWSEELLHNNALSVEQLQRIRPWLSALRAEVMLGQYLDLYYSGRAVDSQQAAFTIARYKTAKYTMERPLQLGVALAGGSDELLATCSAFAIPIGEAFQFQDDILGVFGDPTVTGKSNLDDLREGKCTTLVSYALRHGTSSQRVLLDKIIGNPEMTEVQAQIVREILASTGARDAVEKLIDHRLESALLVLNAADIADDAKELLRQVAIQATKRQS